MSQEEHIRCKSFSCDVVLLDSFCVENAACAVALPYRLLRALFCLLATSIPPGWDGIIPGGGVKAGKWRTRPTKRRWRRKQGQRRVLESCIDFCRCALVSVCCSSCICRVSKLPMGCQVMALHFLHSSRASRLILSRCSLTGMRRMQIHVLGVEWRAVQT